ncbi:hypothetical protein ACSQ67_025450 [Phaseolus vulgaris]
MGYNLLIWLGSVVLVGITFLDWNEVEALGFGVVALVPCESRTVGSTEESWAWLTTGWEIDGAWCDEWFPAGMALEIGLSRDAAAEWDVERSGFGAWVIVGGALGSDGSRKKKNEGSRLGRNPMTSTTSGKGKQMERGFVRSSGFGGAGKLGTRRDCG